MLRNYLLLSLIPLLLLISVTPYVDAQNSLKCPDGAYYGKDNSGNDVCRDIDTNKIIKTATSQSTTSQSASQTPSQQKSPSFFDMISQFFQNLFGGVSSEPLKKSVDILSNPPSIDLPLLSEDKTSKLEDCSIYKKQIQGSTDVDKIYDAVIKTDACEERNKKITMKQGTATSQSGSYPPVTLKMDNKSRGGVTADFTIESVRVQNSDYYKIVNVEMSMLLHMKLNDSIVFSPTVGWKLKDPSGEYYYEKCHGRQSDLGIIFGDSNPNRKWSICFHVEKESKQFDLMKDSNKIGTIILDENMISDSMENTITQTTEEIPEKIKQFVSEQLEQAEKFIPSIPNNPIPTAECSLKENEGDRLGCLMGVNSDVKPEDWTIADYDFVLDFYERYCFYTVGFCKLYYEKIMIAYENLQ